MYFLRILRKIDFELKALNEKTKTSAESLKSNVTSIKKNFFLSVI